MSSAMSASSELSRIPFEFCSSLEEVWRAKLPDLTCQIGHFDVLRLHLSRLMFGIFTFVICKLHV